MSYTGADAIHALSHRVNLDPMTHHKIISLFKSLTRIVGYTVFMFGHTNPTYFMVGVTLILCGEVMGILEELVQ